MRFVVESWAPEYGVSGDESQLDDRNEPVNLDVEVPADQWQPIDGDPSDAVDRVLFVDGIRRTEAQIWVSEGHTSRLGVCASVAAGAVLCTPEKATVVDAEVFRGFYAGPLEGAKDIETRHGCYTYVQCSSDQPEHLNLGIQNRMTSLETAIVVGPGGGGQQSLDTGADLVIFDGPIRGRNQSNGVGYIKTQHVQYLPESHQSIIGRLTNGQRTPVFHIDGSFSRYSWYIRLPSPPSHPLAGVVRCEVSATGEAAEAANRAAQTIAVLPRYASEPHKEPRAPQNLYPIAGLEAQLRRRLGDPLILDRALRIAAG